MHVEHAIELHIVKIWLSELNQLCNKLCNDIICQFQFVISVSPKHNCYLKQEGSNVSISNNNEFKNKTDQHTYIVVYPFKMKVSTHIDNDDIKYNCFSRYKCISYTILNYNLNCKYLGILSVFELRRNHTVIVAY